MSERAETRAFPTILLDHTFAIPLYRQLYDGLQQAILSGQLLSGTKLPSTRALAIELGISRNTVLNAYSQLMAEGYLEAQHGSGTRVAQALPDDLLSMSFATSDASESAHDGHTISDRGRRLADTVSLLVSDIAPDVEKPRAFLTGVPALDAFPHAIWGRLLTRCWLRWSGDIINYRRGVDYQPLREAIAAYLGPARGVRCTADQVVVVTGSQQGIELVAQVLLDPRDAAWLEGPSYPLARRALLGADARIIAVPVDSQGLDVAAGVARCPKARLAFITPSHQFPTGVVMSLERRLELLEWAGQADAWILEDDYDSEFRYTGRPLAALQGLDREGHVIYMGKFSKSMFPALRLGYLIVPPI